MVVSQAYVVLVNGGGSRKWITKWQKAESDVSLSDTCEVKVLHIVHDGWLYGKCPLDVGFFWGDTSPANYSMTLGQELRFLGKREKSSGWFEMERFSLAARDFGWMNQVPAKQNSLIQSFVLLLKKRGC